MIPGPTFTLAFAAGSSCPKLNFVDVCLGYMITFNALLTLPLNIAVFQVATK
jgi:hypothetical protein